MYNPVQNTEIAHNGTAQTAKRSGHNETDTIDARPVITEVLCKQFPTVIHRAVSSPSLAGSTMI